VVTVDRENRVTFSERTFAPDARGRFTVSTETMTFQAMVSGAT
jgi:hypothetical protein